MVLCEVNQLNDPTTTFDGLNCNCASDAMLVCRDTGGRITPTGGQIRTLTGDTSGGTNLRQVHNVNVEHYDVHSILATPIAWSELAKYAPNHGFVLALSYSVLRYTKFDCFRHNFGANHSIWINSRNPDGTWRGRDPGADGRYAGCPDGYQNYPDWLLKKAAGLLSFGSGETMNSKYGAGHAYVLFSSADPLPVSTNQPHVVSSAPTPSERNVMIAQGGLTVVSNYTKALAQGQPLFRYPGGPRVTAMSKSGKVDYIGGAGSGWHAVKVNTRGPYADGVIRPTVLYVPASAGPVARK